MTMDSPDVAAVPWYPNETVYESFRDAAEDPQEFFDSFEEWKVAALEHERQAERVGVILLRIRMSLDEFQSYCVRSYCHNDQSGRSQFAYHKAEQIIKMSSGRGTP
ncbi:hypothetical protein SH467x_002486 [Pirellulaceae bacterium SH467]|jgi:hypothetical protein